MEQRYKEFEKNPPKYEEESYNKVVYIITLASAIHFIRLKKFRIKELKCLLDLVSVNINLFHSEII